MCRQERPEALAHPVSVREVFLAWKVSLKSLLYYVGGGGGGGGGADADAYSEVLQLANFEH